MHSSIEPYHHAKIEIDQFAMMYFNRKKKKEKNINEINIL